GAMPAVPPPAWKLGFDKPCRSVNRACHTGGDRAKCTLELAVELRRANRDSLDLVQKFPQVHFSHPPWVDGSNGAPGWLTRHSLGCPVSAGAIRSLLQQTPRAPDRRPTLGRISGFRGQSSAQRPQSTPWHGADTRRLPNSWSG